ncbi:MAG: Spy/CpxP family protein refolding chaperone [bacterium]|nr:Spy/CpxP family protein refolding chaperone [bacterium]
MKKWKENLKVVPTGLAGLAVVLIAASLAIAPSVFAQDTTPPTDENGPPYGMGKGKGGHGGGPMKGLFEILDEDQKEKVTAILEAHREDAESTHDAMKTKNEELRELIKSDATEATVMAKAEEISGIKAELFKGKIAMQIEIRALLTDEQKQELDEIMDKMGPGGPGGKHGKGGGPGKGHGFRDGSCIGK